MAIAITIGVALLMGFRPSASFAEWLGVIGIVALTVGLSLIGYLWARATFTKRA
ncbi:hypothetical protein ACTWPT_53695 [Nonomuraea sp. 3N208]|uniref:hypothetical protein n=1 Tax=Nonomuraea sp. 3N208 TaxID=3457421 RepID=UPI003FCF1AED